MVDETLVIMRCHRILSDFCVLESEKPNPLCSTPIPACLLRTSSIVNFKRHEGKSARCGRGHQRLT